MVSAKVVPSPVYPEFVEGERACPELAEGGRGEVKFNK